MVLQNSSDRKRHLESWKIWNNPISQLLMETTKGKTVLAYWKTHGQLIKTIRSLLSRIIIEKERDRQLEEVLRHPGIDVGKFTISNGQFLIWSKQIVEVFPSEASLTYYSPYSSRSMQVIQPNGEVVKKTKKVSRKGTLVDHYVYLRGKTNHEGLLKARGHAEEEDPSHTDDQSGSSEWLTNEACATPTHYPSFTGSKARRSKMALEIPPDQGTASDDWSEIKPEPSQHYEVEDIEGIGSVENLQGGSDSDQVKEEFHFVECEMPLSSTEFSDVKPNVSVVKIDVAIDPPPLISFSDPGPRPSVSTSASATNAVPNLVNVNLTKRPEATGKTLKRPSQAGSSTESQHSERSSQLAKRPKSDFDSCPVNPLKCLALYEKGLELGTIETIDCDNCDGSLLGSPWYHCTVCRKGRFDLCPKCYAEVGHIHTLEQGTLIHVKDVRRIIKIS